MADSKSEKRKISDRIITTLIILALAAFGGWFAYHKFFEGNVANNLEDTVTETEFVEVALFRDNTMDEYSEVCNIMDRTEGSYFNVVLNNDSGGYDVYKMSKASFEEENSRQTSVQSEDTLVRRTYNTLHSFLNASYYDDDIQRSGYEKGSSTIVWDKHIQSENCEASDEALDRFSKSFDGDIDTYFLENELELKCDTIKINKIALSHLTEEQMEEWDVGDSVDYYVSGEAVVETESAKEGFEGNELIPPVGESRTIKVRLFLYQFNWTGGAHFMYEFIEMLPE